MADERQLK